MRLDVSTPCSQYSRTGVLFSRRLHLQGTYHERKCISRQCRWPRDRSAELVGGGQQIWESRAYFGRRCGQICLLRDEEHVGRGQGHFGSRCCELTIKTARHACLNRVPCCHSVRMPRVGAQLRGCAGAQAPCPDPGMPAAHAYSPTSIERSRHNVLDRMDVLSHACIESIQIYGCLCKRRRDL